MARPDSWFRMYNTVLDNPKVQRLPGDLFKSWVNLLCLASKCGGKLPGNGDVAFALRIDETAAKQLLETFHQRELLDFDGRSYSPHDWTDLQFKSDVSTPRVKQFRERQKKPNETVPETPDATPPEERRTEHSRTEQRKGAVQDLVSSSSRTLKNQKPFTKEEKKIAWQSKICVEAKRCMSADGFQEFMVAWTSDDPKAIATAEEIDKRLKANSDGMDVPKFMKRTA